VFNVQQKHGTVGYAINLVSQATQILLLYAVLSSVEEYYRKIKNHDESGTVINSVVLQLSIS
jgi:hypothetical protein